MSRKSQEILLLVFIIFIFFQIVFLTPKSVEKTDLINEIEQSSPMGNKGDQRMEGVHLVEGQGDSKEWELYSEIADGFIGQGVWKLKVVRVIFYSQAGDTYTVVGDQGEINYATKDIVISGKVFTSSSNGYEVKTNLVQYISKDKILKIPNEISVVGPKDNFGYRLFLKSTGMETFLENSLMIMKSKITAERTLNTSSGPKLVRIKSGMAHLSGKSNLLRFFEKVKISYEKFEVLAPEAFFVYKEKNDSPESILINGGVLIEGEQRQATAENVKIDVLQDQYVLRGSPKVVQDGDEIKGERIIFLNGGESVRVENANAVLDDTTDKK